jgi:hypothetical protein
MAKLGINTGIVPDDGLGDSLLDGAVKINDNFDEIYTYFGDGTNLTFTGGSSSQWVTTSAGIHTLSNVGIGTTNPTENLTVFGDARVTGILTIGTASITLDGSSNTITVGSGVTIDGSTGIIEATSLVVGGTTLTGAAVTSITAGSGISVDQSTGNVTISATGGGGGGESYWTETSSGIHTLSKVGIGTTNPTSALTVKGNTSLETLSVSGVSTFTSDIEVNGVTVGRGGSSSGNTGVGQEVLESDTLGERNTAVGYRAMFSTTAGEQNTALGYEALFTSTGTTPNASYNTAVGHRAMRLNTTGSQNVSIGGESLNSNTSGFGHVAVGFGAGDDNTTGNYSIAIGWGAKVGNGGKNVVIGANNGTSLTSGSGNVLIGPGEQNTLSPLFQPPNPNGSNQLVVGSGFTAWIYGNNQYNVGIGTTNPTSALTVKGNTSLETLSVSGISTLGTVQVSSGIVTSTSGTVTYYGDTSNTTDGRWTLGANGTSDYTFTGIGFTQTTNDPVLYLARGRVYEFVNNSGGSHPFEIRVSNGGSAYNDGVTNNGAASGVIRFEIPFNAPNTLYYQCTAHSGMGNTISVYPSTI